MFMNTTKSSFSEQQDKFQERLVTAFERIATAMEKHSKSSDLILGITYRLLNTSVADHIPDEAKEAVQQEIEKYFAPVKVEKNFPPVV